MAEMMLINPRKRTRRKTTKRKSPRRRTMTAVRSRAPVARRRRRHNPSTRGFSGIMKNSIMPSATAAGGALGLDVVMGLLPIPETMKTGPMRHIVKGAGAIGMGMLAGMFLKKDTAQLITTGALTVAMYGAGKEVLGKAMPQLTLGDYDDMDDYSASLGYQSGPDEDLGMYDSGMGSYSVDDDYDEI